ncbi:peptidase M, partial [Trifolium medium]|nr:peptidase M [Trifolium medium]
ADFVRMKAGYASDQWSPPGVEDQWDQGYEVTAHFLDFCG